MSEEYLASRQRHRDAVQRFEKEIAGLRLAPLAEGHLIEPNGLRRRATLIRAPRVLSVARARDDFLGLIYQQKRTTYIERPPWTRAYDHIVFDLSQVEELGLDAALVLTSEYHNACIASAEGVQAYKPIIDDSRWRPHVRQLFRQLGLYNLVQAEERSDDTGAVPAGLQFVPFISEQQVKGERLDHLLEALRAAAGQTPEREAAYAALLEAANNSREHAYPLDQPPVLGPNYPRWWAAGAYDPERGVLEFAVYDHGVGIATTLPKQGFFQSVLRLSAPERTDADIIAGGIRYGRSRHKIAHLRGNSEAAGRGNGLWTICMIVDQLAGSFVRISSDRGEVEYHGVKDVRKKMHRNPFCGTLIEWTLKLPTALTASV